MCASCGRTALVTRQPKVSKKCLYKKGGLQTLVKVWVNVGDVLPRGGFNAIG